MKAVWNETVIAESNETVVEEGNHYFPSDALNKDFFEQSDHTSVCGWKGTANYFTLTVNGKVNKNAAWYYPSPKTAADHIKGKVAFWKGVKVI